MYKCTAVQNNLGPGSGPNGIRHLDGFFDMFEIRLSSFLRLARILSNSAPLVPGARQTAVAHRADRTRLTSPGK